MNEHLGTKKQSVSRKSDGQKPVKNFPYSISAELLDTSVIFNDQSWVEVC